MSGLYLFPIAGEASAFEWARVRGGKIDYGRASPDEALRTLAGERVTLVAPGQNVALRVVELSLRSDAHALAAARYAIEDDLAQPLEDVLVVLGPRGKGRTREAAVVAHARLDAWRAGLEAIGVSADRVVPDYLALPVEPDALQVVDLGDRVLVRGEGVGFAVDVALALELLSAVVAAKPERAVRLRSDRPDAILPRAARDGRRIDQEPAPGGDELIRLFDAALPGGATIDLARAWRTRPGGAVALKDWRLAASLAGAAALTFLALLGVQTATLQASASTAQADAGRILQAAFPDIERVGNVRTALRARLGDGGTGRSASFLGLSAVLSESVAEVGGLEVESIRFDETDGGLAASIRYSAYADVAQLRAAVEARGARLTEGSSRLQGGRMAGEIEVTAP
jgi:general secretion pathway protein L